VNLPENTQDTILQLKNLRVSGVSKEGSNINLDLKKGEIHAIMGESGAGKTGIAHILAGINKNQGIIYINNQLVEIKNPFHSLALGIGVLFQNYSYSFIPRLTVKEFLYIWADSFFISSKRLTEKTVQMLQEYEIDVNPNALMYNLNQEECRLLSLMKLLAHKPLIVALDEPSSDLSEVKKQHLFRIIRKYAENGNGILYLSNKLDEILQIGDRVTILKDGGTIDSFSIEYAKKNPGKILSLYFGREEQNNFSDDEFKDVIDTLLHTTELLTSEYELQDLLNLLVGKISETSKADGCSILLLDELSTNVVESFRHRRSNLPIFDLKEEIVSDVITSGQPLIINHLTEDEMARLFAQPNEVKALACVPIRVRTKINGAIEVFYTQKKNFTQEDIEVLMTFATQVAIAIENTRLLGRSTLLKEAHHRIKNNLQSIISLLILQLQTKSEKSLESIVWQIIDRIKTIASIHEILSQDEKGIGLINFNNLVKLIIANFNEKDFSGRVETLLEIDDLYVSYRTATSMGLIINELLANCFEHAFPEGKKGKIILRLHHDEDNVTLQVIDNGMGFKEVQPNSAGTLGLSLVKTLVSRDLRGSFEIASRMGTRVCIIFPKKQINY
jgi:ribose transport system ATP-binding protein